MTKRRPITVAQWRAAIRTVLDARGGRPRPLSKTWQKGGKEYEKILGYFGPPRRRPK